MFSLSGSGKKYKSKVSNSKTSKVWFAISSDLLTFTHVDLTVWFLSQQAMTFDHNLTNLTLFLSIDLEKNWDFNQIKFKISNVYTIRLQRQDTNNLIDL